MTELAGSVAIVTGSARRLGREIAMALAVELHMDVVVHCNRSADNARDVRNSIEQLGQRSSIVCADLGDPDDAAKAIIDAAKGLGQPRVLVNNASIFADRLLDELDLQHVQKHFAVNSFAPLLLTQEFAAAIPKDGHGHVINMLDWRAERPTSTHLAYTASKTALLSLTQGLSLQLAPRIQVNGIAPGAILPPDDRPKWHSDRAKTEIPLRRTGQPSDVCDAIVYLLRSKFVTGEVLHVTGGEEL